MRENRGILTVVSGFSGAGKGTVMAELLQNYPEYYALSISATTRDPRPYETDGVEYFFKTEEEFRRMIDNGELIEYAQYVGHYYGTPRDYVDQQLDAGRDVILEIEIQGALKIKQQRPDTILMFLTPPDAAELYRRLARRGTESEEVIRSRLTRALQEADGVDAYDYLVVNDVLEECVRKVHSIIQNEHARMYRNTELIGTLQKDLEQFLSD